MQKEACQIMINGDNVHDINGNGVSLKAEEDFLDNFALQPRVEKKT